MVIFNNYFTTNVGVWVIQSAEYFDRATLGEVTLFNHRRRLYTYITT